MGTLADRRFEMTLRNRVLFGVGEIGRLPEVVAAAGGSRVFVVTDPGVRAAGIVEPVLEALGAAGLPTAVFDEIEPNPAAATVERGAASLRDFGLAGAVVVAMGGGSAMDAAKAIDLRAANDRPVWELEYDGPDLTPGRADRRGPDDRRHRRRGPQLRGHHPRGDRAQGLRRPPVTAPGHDRPRSRPDRRVAAGRHGRDGDRRDDPLARDRCCRANPNPFAEAMALGVIRTVGDVAAPGRRRRLGSRGALADADGLAPRRRRPGQRDRRRPRPRARPLDRNARQGRPWDGARVRSCPRSCASTSARAIASSRSSGSRSASPRPPRPTSTAAGAGDRRHRQASARPRPAADPAPAGPRRRRSDRPTHQRHHR